VRRSIADRLRFLADRIDPASAFRMSHLRFYFRTGVGLVVDREGHRGCPLWWRGPDYHLAHEVDAHPCPAGMSWSGS
jgi:hypothetical protein